MNKTDDLLQQRLEQFENGVPLAECLSGLPPEEAELLQLAVQLQEIAVPAPATASVSAQRAAVLAAAVPPANNPPMLAGFWLFLKGLLATPTRQAGAFALAAVMVIAFLVWVNQPDGLETEMAQEITKETAVLINPDEAESSANQESAEIAAIAPEQAPDPATTTFLPILTAALPTGPHLASLTDVQGFVQVQEAGEDWQTITGMAAVAAGAQIRTGALSSAKLTFYDNSQAHLGPDSGLTIEQLDAKQPDDGFRTVLLNQWQGESSHSVQFRHDGGSRYEVRTPDGSGIARGTQFQVAVSPEQFSRISVTEGRVDVSGSGRTVSVAAGSLTTIPANEPPSTPAFIITGQGELSAKGDTWIIAGQPFVVNSDTVIVGDPEIGDIVFVSGYLADDGQNVANRIELVRPSPVNQFTLTGIVTEMGAASWVVAGQTILLDDDTEIDDTIILNNKVHVSGKIEANGALLATTIARLPDSDGYPFVFTGVVQTMADTLWQISGMSIVVDGETAVSPNIQVGDLVRVTGLILPDQSWLATAIDLVEPGTAAFTISGLVQNMSPWQVAGRQFETNAQTLIDDGIQVGDRVRVTGRILADGTWLADQIELVDEDYLMEIIFAGIVDSMDPWVVNGLPLTTNDDTLIDDDIAIGDLVRVTARIRADGSWLAVRIDRLSGAVDEGCVSITAVVTQIGNGILTLSNGSTIDMEDVEIEGDLKVGSVVLIIACVDEDGTIQIQQIIVLYTPVISPTPTPRPNDDDDDDDNDNSGGNVTICHKPGTPAQQTKTVPQSALGGHLGHGDTLGACP